MLLSFLWVSSRKLFLIHAILILEQAIAQQISHSIHCCVYITQDWLCHIMDDLWRITTYCESWFLIIITVVIVIPQGMEFVLSCHGNKSVFIKLSSMSIIKPHKNNRAVSVTTEKTLSADEDQLEPLHSLWDTAGSCTNIQ